MEQIMVKVAIQPDATLCTSCRFQHEEDRHCLLFDRQLAPVNQLPARCDECLRAMDVSKCDDLLAKMDSIRLREEHRQLQREYLEVMRSVEKQGQERKVVDYLILRNCDGLEDLQDDVKERLAEGWLLFGGPQYLGGGFVQPMVKTEKPVAE
jgi:hypothetical protein